MKFLDQKIFKQVLNFLLLSFTANIILFFIIIRVSNYKIKFNSNFSLLITIVLILTLVETTLFWYNERSKVIQQMIIINNLKRISKGNKATKIELSDSDNFYRLAEVVNKVSDRDRHNIHKLTNKENELQSIINNLPMGVLVIKKNKIIDIINKVARGSLNIKVDSSKIYYKDVIDIDQLNNLIKKAFKKHKNVTGTITDKTGNILETTIVYSPKVHNSFELIILMYDVTSVLKAKKIEEDFINNASHELRTPITAIAGFAETLVAGAKDDKKNLSRFLNIIKDESYKLVDLIDDILILSRNKNNSDSYEKIKLKNFIDTQLQLLDFDIKNKKLIVKNNIPEELSQSVLKNNFLQIIKNILNNAVIYNRTGGDLEISYSENNTSWSIKVRDSGLGINSKHIDRIFDRFYRSENNIDNIKGTGLGLSIVKNAVNNMDGDVTIDSVLDKYTNVICTFNK